MLRFNAQIARGAIDASFAEAYEEVVAGVRKATQLEPTGRPAKSTTSIVEKLRRETMRLTQMQDIAGCRLVVQDVLAQNKVVAQLTAALPNAVVVDRRKHPSHGYRAVHIIANAKGKPVEIQIRTELQHLWAQLSEKASDVFDPAIKYGGGNLQILQAMSQVSKVVADVEALEADMEALELELGGLEQVSREGPELQQLKKEAERLARLKRDLRKDLAEASAKIEASPRRQTGG